MKRVKKLLGVALRLALAIGILSYLLLKIDQKTVRVTFRIAGAQVEEGSVYAVPELGGRQFLVLESGGHGTRLATLPLGEAPQEIPASGTLTIVKGHGPATLAWQAADRERYGLRLIGALFAENLSEWPKWLLGLGLVFLALGCGIVRWRLILASQGLMLSWQKVFSIFYIGHFFNSFMLGATGGDVVKAYYVAKETRHNKTEAVTTVFIDRMIGLVAMLALGFLMMMTRVPLFLREPALHLPGLIALVLVVGAVVAGVTVFSHNIFERWSFFRRLETRFSFGPVIKRAYEAFFLLRRRPGLVGICFVWSLLTHSLVVAATLCYGHTLHIRLGAIDYFTFFPIINMMAALPITPGGLGIREGLTVRMAGAVGVPSVQALPLSLMVYASVLVWSMFGGLVFLLHTAGTGHGVREEMSEISG